MISGHSFTLDTANLNALKTAIFILVCWGARASHRSNNLSLHIFDKYTTWKWRKFPISYLNHGYHLTISTSVVIFSVFVTKLATWHHRRYARISLGCRIKRDCWRLLAIHDFMQYCLTRCINNADCKIIKAILFASIDCTIRDSFSNG